MLRNRDALLPDGLARGSQYGVPPVFSESTGGCVMRYIEALLKEKGVMCLVSGRDPQGRIEADVYAFAS